MAKRLFDLLVASAGLVLLAPLMLCIAVWIRLDSAGPALFRQERVGRHGELFRIHKFRTMCAAVRAARAGAGCAAEPEPGSVTVAEPPVADRRTAAARTTDRPGADRLSTDPPVTDPQITVGADPRITRAGRWLRRTKLDELPQLIDVVRGRMSLVGPRPEVPRYVALYPAALRAKVLSVRPGITDPASIEYRDEASRLARAADPEREYVEVVMPHKLRRAAAYVDAMSLGGDLRLIGATLRALLRR